MISKQHMVVPAMVVNNNLEDTESKHRPMSPIHGIVGSESMTGQSSEDRLGIPGTPAHQLGSPIPVSPVTVIEV